MPRAVATARANTLRQPGLAEGVQAEHEAIVAAVTHLRNAARRLGLTLRARTASPSPAQP